MKKIQLRLTSSLTLMMLAAAICSGYAQHAPPHAASTKTWTIGEQTWSDHINIPACNKTSFDGGDDNAPKADCRNNPGYYYLYSWEYVRRNAADLCPAPWRVPSLADFGKLADLAVRTDHVAEIWGVAYGGYALSSSVNETNVYAYYWSSTEYNINFGGVFFVDQSSGHIKTDSGWTPGGFQVRCVK
jgi:hypothetical protein